MVSHKVGLDASNFSGHIEEDYARRRMDFLHTERANEIYSFEKGA